MSWQKFSPDELAWQGVADHQERVITSEPYPLTQKRIAIALAAGAAVVNAGGVLVLLLAGELQLDDGRSIKAEDLLWVPAGVPVCQRQLSGRSECYLSCMCPGGYRPAVTCELSRSRRFPGKTLRTRRDGRPSLCRF